MDRVGMDCPVHVVLVHGTILFGRFAFLRRLPWIRKLLMPPVWIRHHSQFSTFLKTRFSEHNVDIQRVRRVCWTGGNSVKDRQAAAKRLRTAVARILRYSPTAQVYIIAHSHGGNVALEAMHDLAVANGVKGIVCLGTPFFRYRIRDVTIVMYAFAMLLYLAFVVLALVVAVSLFDPSPDSISMTWGVIFWLFVFGPGAYGIFRFMRPWCSRCRLRAEHVVDQLGTPQMKNTEILCIESGVQEARWILGLGRLIREFLPFVLRRVWLASCMGLAVCLIFLRESLRRGDGILDWLYWLMAGIYGLPFLIPLTALLAAYVYSNIFIGVGSAFDSLFVETDVDLTPADSVGDLRITLLERKIFGGLQHCRLHDEKDVVSKIADFIRAVRAGDVRPQSHPPRFLVPS